jgi:hypothetical protein
VQKSVAGKTDCETVLEIQELLPLAASHVVNLGAAVLAVAHLAPQMRSQEFQPPLGVFGQPGSPDFADPADWLSAPLERLAASDHGILFWRARSPAAWQIEQRLSPLYRMVS